jgi:hypothetical protein
MATTTNYSWSTPDDTALVKDGAAAIRSLGTAIDTTVFTNAGAAINKSIVDAAGDLIYGTADNTVARLALGTASQVLRVNSGATAPEWATPAASGGMTLINTGGTTLTGASISFTSIPSTYKNLQLVIRNYKPANDNASLVLTYNGDTTSVYYDSDSDNVTNANANQSGITCGINNDNAVAQGLTITNIYDYANAVSYKVAESLSFGNNSTTTTNFNLYHCNALWKNTAAINRVDINPNTGNFTSGTAFLYGVS